MAMTRTQKAAMIDEIVAKLENTPALYVTNYGGLTVAQANDLRTRLREAGVEFKVYKNTFLRLAMDRIGGYEELYDYLNGPTAIALSDEPATPARVFKKYLDDKDKEIPALKGAFIDGSIYHEGSLDALAALKSKDELLGDIIGLLMAPMTNVIGGLQGQGSTLVAILQTLAEREEA